MSDKKTKNKLAKITVVICVIIVIIGFCWYQNVHLVISKYEFENEHITGDLDGFRIVQISDLHNARFGKDNSRLVTMIDGVEPDIIVITGDLVDSSHTNIETAANLVKALSEKYEVYYVTGNHEYWLEDTDYNRLLKEIIGAGAIVLKDEAINIVRGNESFSLIGIDDRSLTSSILQEIVKDKKDMLTVVLAHEPQYIKRYALAGADLILAGHAHGGQFILPIVGAIVAPDQGMFPEYTAGEYVEGNTHMFVSRGLGNSVIHVRLFNYPEIVCIELKMRK